MKTRSLLILLFFVLPLLTGCESLYFMAGQGKEKAAFTLPKDKRVLVFVDLRQSINNAPADFASALGDKISNHLFKYNAATKLVGQDRITALKRDPDNFSKMGVADVARSADADLVIYVDVVTLNIAATTDNSLSGASCQCFVKVIDSNGVRMWPSTESSGSLVNASVEPTFTDNRTEPALMNQLQDLLATRTGRLFHPYSRDDQQMAK